MEEYKLKYAKSVDKVWEGRKEEPEKIEETVEEEVIKVDFKKYAKKLKG